MALRICSVAPREFKIRRSYAWNDLVIPPCTGDLPYTSLLVTDREDVEVIHTSYDAKEARRIPVVITAQQIVSDFFGAEQLAPKGCFICAGETPTKAELSKAKDTRRAYLQKLVQNGDIEYSRSGKVDDISGESKEACEELEVERPWAFLAPKVLQGCPACGESVKPNVAICKSCGAILDHEKAAQYGLIDEGDVKAKRGKAKQAEAVAAT